MSLPKIHKELQPHIPNIQWKSMEQEKLPYEAHWSNWSSSHHQNTKNLASHGKRRGISPKIYPRSGCHEMGWDGEEGWWKWKRSLHNINLLEIFPSLHTPSKANRVLQVIILLYGTKFCTTNLQCKGKWMRCSLIKRNWPDVKGRWSINWTATSLKPDSQLSLHPPLLPMTREVFLSFPLFLFSIHWGQCMFLSMGEGIEMNKFSI